MMENNNWVELPIKDVALKLTSGGTPSTKNSEYYANGNIPWLNTKEVDFNRITSTEKYITEEGLKNSSAKWIQENSVIVAMYGATAAKVAISKIPLTTNQACCNIIVNHDVCDYEYLFYNISNKYSELENIAVGAAQQNLSVGVIGEFILKFPPLPEQKAIASVLSSLDDKIDLLQQQNQTLEALAETLFRQWFIEEAKEDWEIGKLEDLVLSANTGLDAIRRAPIVENYTGIKCLRIQDISQNKTFGNWGNTEVKDSDFVKAQLKRGDIIMARTCSPGILLHVQEDLNAVFNNGLARIRANKNSHPIFLKYLFKTNEFINHIYGISDGTAVQLNMKLGDLLSYDLKIPPIDFIEKFVQIVSEWDDKIFINQQQIQTLTQLRDTLLPKLMSGEQRVKV